MTERRVCGGLPHKKAFGGRVSPPGFCALTPGHEGTHVDNHGRRFREANPKTCDTRKLGTRAAR